ncbi:unnamed protein product [Rotaria magnacalcarata]|uniref:SWIM-type domain-containing protein n=1 Tax=Rotaria magnacalcarata TaxID=392030 RepID=A0A820CIL4_9BILA|nr:unnamed protein product [Rotaria magnacalcarata]CAF4215935.1 unnamed protein product [Rotaria magnacalcarata]
MSFQERCYLCNALFKNRRSYTLIESQSLFDNINLLYELLHSQSIKRDCQICNVCYQKHSKRLKLSDQRSLYSARSSNVESMTMDFQANKTTHTVEKIFHNKAVTCTLLGAAETIQVPVCVPPISHKYCSICLKTFGRASAMNITDNIRFDALLNNMVYFRPECRFCTTHIEEEKLSSNAIRLVKTNHVKVAGISADTFKSMLNDIWSEWKRCNTAFQAKLVAIDFNQSLRYTDHDYWTLVGITKENFNGNCNHLGMRNTSNRSIHMAVGCLLTKLRLGLSNNVLATLFSFSSKRVVGKVIESARKSLVKNFVPKYLGFEHITRDKIIQDHTRPLAKYLLTGGKDSAVLILDSTYIYCQKSACNLLQRRLFSMHKSRPLIKPMMCVATVGYICSAIGPYFADWCNNDANIMNHILHANEEEILNWFKPDDTFVVDRGFRDSLDYIRSLGFNMKNWQKINGAGAAPNFPTLTQEQLQELTLGIFQIKQAISYANEHINEDGSYEIMISTQTNGFLKAKIQSRHSNKKLYHAIVQYNNRTVLEWCCQCPYGNVTIGTCSHVASILWYLGLARHDTSKLKQLSSNYVEVFKDASPMLLADDDGDDEDNDDDDEDDEEEEKQNGDDEDEVHN